MKKSASKLLQTKTNQTLVFSQKLHQLDQELDARYYFNLILKTDIIKIYISYSFRYNKLTSRNIHAAQFGSSNNGIVYSAGPYGDPGYLQMALGAYLTPSSSGYKSVDPYFLSQGMDKINYILNLI